MKIRIVCISVLVFNVIPLGTRADVIILKNDNKIKGIIEKEDAEKVIVEIGVGSMTIPRKQILKVVYDSEETKNVLRKEWAEKYFLNEKYVPPSMKELASNFKAISNVRSGILDARANIKCINEQIRKKEIEAYEIKENLSTLVDSLTKLSPSNDIGKYNATVERVNILRIAQLKCQNELDDLMKKQRELETSLLSYVGRILEYENAFKKNLAAQNTLNAEEKKFILLLEAKLSEYMKDVEKNEVQIIYKNRSYMVRVNVNNVIGTFIIDTGAAIMTITDKFFNQLKDRPPFKGKLEMIMADGTKRLATVVVLPSVKVGNVELRDIEAAVISSHMEDEIDGLLGMNFLSHFYFSINNITGKLELNYLK